MVAVVRCNGTCEARPKVNEYDGYPSCYVKSLLYTGDTGCAYGCLGCGDCVAACQFGALSMDPVTGLPVVDVLWFTGDEVGYQKPDQKIPFPDGYKYDYCNPDGLLHRISVQNGRLVTPEGQSYGLLWVTQTENMQMQSSHTEAGQQ